MSDFKTIKISPRLTKKEDAVKEFDDSINSLQGYIGLEAGMSNDKKELALREWLTINMDTIRDETNIYSIDDLIERLNSVCKLEAALENACKELEGLSKELGCWKTKEEWKMELLK